MQAELLADFSDGASDVIDAHVASTTGVRSPSLSVRGDGQQARQANAGSLVRLTDETYHVIAFTNGVQVRSDAVCLRLKPLAVTASRSRHMRRTRRSRTPHTPGGEP